MEFHAYPSPPQGKACNLRTLWRVQGLLHSSDSVVLPAALLFIAVSMMIYQHMTSDYDKSIRNFLVMIFLSMFPLAFLEKKLFACNDPVGVLSKFSAKVVLMYACFLTLRVISSLLIDGDKSAFVSKNFASLTAACILLPTIFGFRMSRACIWEHRDVLCIAMMALMAAIFTELIEVFMSEYSRKTFLASSWYRQRYYKLIFVAASDYAEILSFVPAMWMVCRTDKNATVNEVNVNETQTRAIALFAFMITFYLSEDLYNAYQLGKYAPVAAVGHIAHFLLLLDFAAFILAHLFDPEKYVKFMGKFWNLISDRSMV